MKKLLLNLFIILMIGVISCKKDFLDLAPLNYISDNDVWKDEALIRLYVNGVYRGVESGMEVGVDNYNATLSVLTDEARCAYFPAISNTTLITGLYSSTNAPLNNWSSQYSNIRKTNVFLDKIESSSVNQAAKQALTGEIKFLRALSYFELVKRFGGVPLVSKAQDLSDSLLVKRNTMKECYEFIGKDLDDAISLLPTSSSGGIANKWAALALKSRVMIYAASYAKFGVMDSDGFGAIDASKATGYWQQGFDAANEVILNGPYTLLTNLQTLFTPKGSTPSAESIFEIQYNPPIRGHAFHFFNGPNTESWAYTSSTNPSQQLVDAFPMKNGLPISSAASGYNPQDPYKDRDARLDASVFRNGSPWRDIVTRAATVIDTKPGGVNGIVEPDINLSVTHTGYYLKKFIDPAVTVGTEWYGDNYTTWVELRLGEILLNYAEAAVELGKLQEATDAIKKLRDRVGTITQFTIGVGQDSLRNIVRGERRIELCFENHRFWDLRRWRLAEQKLHGLTVNAMWITLNGGVLQHEIKPADITVATPRTFLSKHYLFPIPFSEMQKNNNLKQNPGW